MKTNITAAVEAAREGEVSQVGSFLFLPAGFDDDGERGVPLADFIRLCWPEPSNELAPGPVLDLPEALPAANVAAAGQVLKEILLRDALSFLGVTP